MFVNLGNIFYDAKGTFQWASVAAGISLIAAGISIWGTFRNNKIQKEINQQNIDANLKAKARLDWIDKVRSLVSQYISNSYKIFVTIDKMQRTEKKLSGNKTAARVKTKPNLQYNYAEFIEIGQQEFDLLVSQLDSLVNTCTEISEQIHLLFSEQEEHKKIKELFLDSSMILKELNKHSEHITNNEKSNEFIDKKITDHATNVGNIRKDIGKYLKQEWDKAKNGE